LLFLFENMTDKNNKIIDITKKHSGEGFQILSAKKSPQDTVEHSSDNTEEIVEHEIVFCKRWPLDQPIGGGWLKKEKNYIKTNQELNNKIGQNNDQKSNITGKQSGGGFQKRKRFIIYLILFILFAIFVVGVLGFRNYLISFDKKCLVKYNSYNNIDQAIERGQIFAYSLLENYSNTLDGNECKLLDLSIEQAKSKLYELYNKKEPLYTEYYKAEIYSAARKKGAPFDFLEPVFSDLNNMQLIKLERIGCCVVKMNFAYMTDTIFPKTISILDKKEMIFSVIVSYYIPKSENINQKTMVEKILDFPIVRFIKGEKDLFGYWVVSDFNFS